LGLLLAIAAPASAVAAGELDTTFAGDGKLIADFGTKQDGGEDLALQADGRLVVATGSGLVRYTPSGSPDPSFSGDGRVPLPDDLRGVAIQPDRRIVVTTATAVARFRPNGTPDPSFSGDGRVEAPSSFGAVAVQADGKIVLTGHGSAAGESSVTRLRSDGAVDTSWAGDGTAAVATFGGVNDVATQADGKVLLAWTPASMGSTAFVVIRLTADGSIDRTFGDHGFVYTDNFGGEKSDFADESAFIDGVIVQPDGKIVAVGGDAPFDGGDVPGSYQFAVARLNPNGSPDRSFSRDGKRLVGFGGEATASDVALQPGGRIVLAGSTNPLDRRTADFALARLRRDGSLSGKAVTSLGTDDGARAVATQPDGMIVAAGVTGRRSESAFFGDNLALARYRRLRIDRPKARLGIQRRQPLSRVLRRGLVFRLRTKGLVRGSARLVGGRRSLGRGRPRIFRRGSTRTRVRLTSRAKRRLRRRGGGRLVLRVRLVNAEGTSRTLRARVLVRRTE